MTELRKAIELDPQLAAARRHLALVLYQQGEHDEAIALCRTILVDEPDNGQVHSDLGKMLFDRGKIEDAFAELHAGIKFEPKNAYCHNNLAVDLLNQNQLEEALAEFRAALALDPHFADAHFYLGHALYKLGRPPDAMRHWREAAQDDGKNFHYLLQIAWALATNPDAGVRNGQEAMMWARRAGAVGGDRHPQVLQALAAAYAEMGQFPQAAQTARQALEQVPPDNGSFADGVRSQIILYEAGEPFHERPTHGGK